MTNSLTIAVFLASLCLLASSGQMQAASIVCGSEAKSAEDADSVTTPSTSEVNKFVHSLQCTLEKAKPWIANIEKEAKILEEKARDATISLFQRINKLVNVLASPVNFEKDKEKDKDEQKEPEEVPTTTTTSTSEASSSSKNDVKEELTTSAPPVHLDWLEDNANEVDYIPEKN